MSKDHELNPDFMPITSNDVVDNTLDGFRLGSKPNDYEIIDDPTPIRQEMGRLSLELSEQPQETEVAISNSSRLAVLKYVAQLRNILDKSGSHDSHPQIPGVIRGLSRYLESDDQISDLTKTEINQIASKLNYSHPNTIRLRQLKSDLKEVADGIEQIVSE